MTPEQKLTVDKKEFFIKLLSLMKEYSVSRIEVESESGNYHDNILGICFTFEYKYGLFTRDCERFGGWKVLPTVIDYQDIQAVVKELQEDIDKFEA